MFNFLFRSRSSVVERTTFNRDAVGSTPTAIIPKFQKKLSYINILQKIKIQKLAKRIIVIYNIINKLIKIKCMDENKSFIKEQDFYDNLRILYIEETKKIHVALTNTNGTEGYKDKKEKYYKGIEKAEYDKKYTTEINGLSDKLDNAFKKQYQDAKSIKEKKLIPRVHNLFSAFAIFFDFMEELLFDENYRDLELTLGAITKGFMVAALREVPSLFTQKLQTKDVKRFSQIYKLVLQGGIDLKEEIKNPSEEKKFTTDSMILLLRKHFGDDYKKEVKDLPIGSMVASGISGGFDNSPEAIKDYQYEIEFKQDSKNLTNLQEFLQQNISKKKSNGMEIIDSKLFMRKFFPNFARENLVCEEIIVPKTYEAEKNIINEAVETVKEEEEEEKFYDALDENEICESYKSLSTNHPNENLGAIIIQSDENNINKQNELESNKDLNTNTNININININKDANQNKQLLNNDSNDDGNKKNKNSKQENQSNSTKNVKNIYKKICNFLAVVKNLLLLRSEFKITIKKIQKLNKELVKINNQFNSLDENEEGYKKCAKKHNELLETYGELLKKAGHLIQESKSAKNKNQQCSRELRLSEVNELDKFQRVIVVEAQ